MKKLATSTTAVLTTGFASVALAHGGHGVTAPAGIIHYLTEPLHVISTVGTLAVLAVAIRLIRRKTQ